MQSVSYRVACGTLPQTKTYMLEIFANSILQYCFNIRHVKPFIHFVVARNNISSL